MKENNYFDYLNKAIRKEHRNSSKLRIISIVFYRKNRMDGLPFLPGNNYTDPTVSVFLAY
jgi:hypothetical protein